MKRNSQLESKNSCVYRLGFDEIRSASELCTAAAQGNADLIRRYIKAGINVNAADYDKRTALHIAAAEGNLDVVRAPGFISFYGYLRATNSFYRSPHSMTISAEGDLNVVSALVYKFLGN